jgi:hypothetical protein
LKLQHPPRQLNQSLTYSRIAATGKALFLDGSLRFRQVNRLTLRSAPQLCGPVDYETGFPMHQLFRRLDAEPNDSHEQKTMALNLSAGYCWRRCSRAFSIAFICSLMRRKRSIRRRRAAAAFGGRGTPSGVRTMSIFSAALRKPGLKLRTPNWVRIDFMRLTVAVRSLRSDSRSRCGRLASSSDMVGTKADLYADDAAE